VLVAKVAVEPVVCKGHDAVYFTTTSRKGRKDAAYECSKYHFKPSPPHICELR